MLYSTYWILGPPQPWALGGRPSRLGPEPVLVLHVLVVAVLLLEHHVGGMEGRKSFLNHLHLSDNLATKAELRSDATTDG